MVIDIGHDVPSSFTNDSSRIKQILVILLLNSLKYTQKGSIIIRVTRTNLERTYKIEVEDSGVGISKEDIGKITSEINIRDTRYCKMNMGLGLYIANKLASQLVLRNTELKGQEMHLDISSFE